MDELVNVEFGIGVAVVVGLVEVAKQAFPEIGWHRYAPLASLVAGVAVTMLFDVANGGEEIEWRMRVAIGVLMGLAASGAYSGLDAMVLHRVKGGKDAR